MTATTAAYLALQRVYRERADADVTAVEAHAQRLLVAVGRSSGALPHATVRAFCRNAASLRCAAGQSSGVLQDLHSSTCTPGPGL